MTGPAAQVTEPEGGPQAASGIGRAAVLIGGLTVLARVVGLGRQIVFAHTAGNLCLGTAYATANQLPNIIYDIVLGGALTSIMVPVLARQAERSGGDQAAAREVSQISSALLTWTVAVLVPVSAALAIAAGPLVSLLIPPGRSGCPHAELVAVSTRMLVVFAPLFLLYGLSVVLYCILLAENGDELSAVRAMKNGAKDYVPLARITREVLLGVITEACAKRRAAAIAAAAIVTPGGDGPAIQVPGYSILKEIATSNFSSVFLARSERLRRNVVLKVMNRGSSTREMDDAGRFQREYEIISSIQHRAIAEIYDFG